MFHPNQVPFLNIVALVFQEWNSDKLPVYEPGLDEVIRECRGRNLVRKTLLFKPNRRFELFVRLCTFNKYKDDRKKFNERSKIFSLPLSSFFCPNVR